MPDQYERYGRGSDDGWGGQPGRAAARAAAVEAETGPAKRPPGRKDRSRCKHNRGGPHVGSLVLRPSNHLQHCEWRPAWNRHTRRWEGAVWRCAHEERCACGKILRDSIPAGECPCYPGGPEQKTEAEWKAGDLNRFVAQRPPRRRWDVRGYRKPKAR
jgi:hypothetical protein